MIHVVRELKGLDELKKKDVHGVNVTVIPVLKFTKVF